MRVYKGIPVSPGNAYAQLRWFREAGKCPAAGRAAVSEEPDTNQTETAGSVSEGSEGLAPSELFYAARTRAAEDFTRLAGLAGEGDGSDMSGLFETYALMAEDPDLEDAVIAHLEEGIDPAEAVRLAGEEMSEILAVMDDEYMKERASDVKAVASGIIDALKGTSDEALFEALYAGLDEGESVILAAEDLSPAQTVRLEKSRIAGIVLKKGAVSGHTSILARSLGIPCVLAVGDGLDDIAEGTYAIIDGMSGEITAEPDEAALEAFAVRQKAEEEKREIESRMRGVRLSCGGRPLKIYCNIAGPDDIGSVLENDGEGIGLFRSEFLYLSGGDWPDEETQYRAYRSVLEGMKGHEVIIRTSDIGSDKNIGYFGLPKEENPALGMRALRVSLARPDMFRTQLRALYRASAAAPGSLGIMFPMIASEWELDEAAEACRKVREELVSEGTDIDEGVKLGIMIETPAAAVLSDALAAKADFFSIGTNDLTQYTLAVDRQSTGLGRHYDPHHPAVLKLIRRTAESAHRHGIPVGICGELAGDRELAGFYTECGIDELSVSPVKVLSVRAEIEKVLEKTAEK